MSIADKLLQIAENEQKVYNAGYEKGKADAEPVLQEATFTENGVYLHDEGYDGFGKVTVDVEGGVEEELLTPYTVYLDAYANGFSVTPGKLVFDLEGGFYVDTPGYTTYFYAIGDLTSKLTLTGVKLYNAFPDGTTRENVVFIKNTLEREDGDGMPLCEYVMTSHDVVVTPDPWNEEEPPSEYIIEVPQGLDIDGVMLSCIAGGTPVLKSFTSSYDKGYADGKQAEYDAFWDAFQDNGKRTNYHYAFRYWDENILRPKYDIKPVGSCPSIFRDVKGITDFEQWQKDCGIVVDFSQVTHISDGFGTSSFERFGVLNFSKVANMDWCFNGSKARTIEKIICPTGGSPVYTGAFNNATNLEEIRLQGVIRSNGLDFKSSTKLSADSITSIINALSDETSGLTLTLSETAVDAACAEMELSESTNHTNSSWWAWLISTKSNWTISLA